MKKFIFLFAALLATTTAFAQKGNDGWFISVGGGVNISGEGLKKGHESGYGCTPAFTFDFGKWVNPSIGFKLGYDGFKLKNKVYFPDGVNYNAATFAFMWNIINTFGQYKPERAVNVILYPFAGAAFGRATCFTYGAGLEFPIRLGNVVSLVPNFKGAIISDKMYTDINTGVNGVGECTLALRFRF